MKSEVPRRARLLLDISYFGAPEVREAGQIMERLGHAFKQWHRAKGGGEQPLMLAQMDIASLHAVLELGSAIKKLIDSYVQLKEFLEHTAVAITLLKDSNGGVVPAPIRALIAALVAPVLSKKARDSKLSIEGDNNCIIIIQHADALVLHANLQESKLSIRPKDVPPAIDPRQPEVQESQRKIASPEEDIETTWGEATEAIIRHEFGRWNVETSELGRLITTMVVPIKPIDFGLDEKALYLIVEGRFLYFENRILAFSPERLIESVVLDD